MEDHNESCQKEIREKLNLMGSECPCCSLQRSFLAVVAVKLASMPPFLSLCTFNLCIHICGAAYMFMLHVSAKLCSILTPACK